MKRFLSIIRIVASKEIRENLRDKRALFFAFIYGPLLMPALMLGPAFVAAKSSYVDYEVAKTIHVVGAEYAPNLIQRLREHNLDAETAPPEFRKALEEESIDMVLEIPENYDERLREGRRAPLTLYFNALSSASKNTLQQTRSALYGYSNYLGHLRLNARGQEPDLANALSIIEQDISSEKFGDKFFSGMLYFLLVFNMVMGGFYLAVDSTAGERERNSLETLLSLPARREAFVFGKYLAILTFVALSSFATFVTVFLLLELLPLDKLPLFAGMTSINLIYGYAIILPSALFSAAVLVTAAAFTKSVKEAQTFLGILFLLPMAPFGISQVTNVPLDYWTLCIPFLAQHQLIEAVFLGEAIHFSQFAVSVVAVMVAALLLLALASSFYRSERILGNS